MSTTTTERRLAGLDVFRGMTVAAMVLVNNPGDVNRAYPVLTHAAWHGWTLADVIAPAFLWIVGVAIVLSVMKRRERGESDRDILVRIGRRAAILLAVGIALSAVPDLVPRFDLRSVGTLRLPGTLQRIALCYLVASLLALRLGLRGLLLWSAGLIAGYWALMLLVPVPGHGAGVLLPEGNLAQYVDRILLGRHAKWSDPLGLLSTLPAIGTTLLGTASGVLIRRRPEAGAVVRLLAATGLAMICAGAVLSRWIPVNGSLWSPSFSILMPGLAALTCAACVWWADLRSGSRWSRMFEALGFNALLIFVASQLYASLVTAAGFPALGRPYVSVKGYLVETVFMPAGSREIGSLAYALAVTLAFTALAYLLYRRRWFLGV